ncbi:MAG: VWA domain-containing protein [Bacteroidota bacterium]|nr:VWA domain-containing protein [Bacteroidota bacterium]
MILSFCIFVSFIFPPAALFAAEFTADMVQKSNDKISKSKLYFKDTQYRMEMEQGGQKIIVLVNREAETTQVLMPAENKYMQMEITSLKSQLNNPFEGFCQNALNYEQQELGKEVFKGFECRKILIISGFRKVYTAWISEEFEFPLKIIFHLQKDMYVELNNIKQESINAGLFKIPQGYTEMKIKGAGSERKKSTPKKISKKEYTLKREGGFAGQGITLNARKKSLIRVTDIADDNKGTKGEIDVKTRVAKKKQGNIVYEQKIFKKIKINLKNGESKAWKFPAEAKISYCDIFLTQGSGAKIMIIQPEKAGTSPAEWKTEAADAEEISQPDTSAEPLQKNNVDKQTAADSTTRTTAISNNKTEAAEQMPEKNVSAPAAASSQGKTTAKAANIMFILDASGSMWGEIEGRDKIAIAKEVMAGLIRSLPDNTKTGLVAYGHRRKGDCKDVEELVALAPLDKEKLIEIIQSLSPKGKTPITRSVRITAEKLKTMEDKTTIIMVSDGKESCQGDPCAMVKQLKKIGIKFTMHVIGFDVKKEGRAQLECMAKAGGGKYYTADNADQLQMAAQNVVKEATLLPQTGFLRIVAVRNDKTIKARAKYYRSGETNHLFQNNTPIKDENPGEELEPGLYDVVVIDSATADQPQSKIKGLKVEIGKTTEHRCDFSGGTFSLSVVKNGKPSFAWISVYKPGTKNKVTNTDTSSNNPGILKLVPGKYDVVALDNKVSPPQKIIFEDIIIKPGETIEKTADFSEGTLSMTSLINGEKRTASYYVYHAGTKDKVDSSDTSRDNPKIIKLAPGTYDLLIRNYKVRPKEEKWFKGIEIKGSQTVKKTAKFKEGVLIVSATSNGKKTKAFLKIFKAGEKKKLDTDYTDKKIRLLPDNYELYINAYKLPGEPKKHRVPVTIKAGETNNLDVSF